MFMKKIFKYLVPSLVTLVLLAIVFWCNDLYPFGVNSIVQVDADYQFIPVLYRIYDFLHGNASVIYDDIGLGNSIYTSMIIQGSIFSPITWLVYFVKRSEIINFFNVLVIIKMCLLSLTSYIYIKNTYKVSNFYQILFSVIYTFNGWILLNYFNIMWLDSVILFPLIVLFLDKLLFENKYMGYIITLSLSLIISYYISAFILIFIVFYSFIRLSLFKKDNYKKVILMLGISTLISLFISSFSVIPSVYQTILSSRLSNNSNYPLFGCTINKIIYFMGNYLAIILFSMLMFKMGNDRKNVINLLVLFILFFIGVIFEPINLVLHFGSHWSFPYRYSFITNFILIMGSLYYIEKYDIKNKKINYIFLIISIIGIIGAIYLNYIFKDDIREAYLLLDFNDSKVFKYVIGISFVIIISYVCSLCCGNKRVINFMLGIVTLVSIYITTSWTMFYSSGYFLVRDANNLNDNLYLGDNDIERYKMNYSSYSPDYGFVINRSTLDNWLHILPKGMTDVYSRLGYLNTDTCIRSLGGTILIDNLLYMNNIISKNSMDDNIYSLVSESGDYKLYRYNYKLPFGVIYDDGNYDYDGLSGFYLHNRIFYDLFGVSNITRIEYMDVNDTVSYLKREYDISKGMVYIDLVDCGEYVDYIVINDQYIYDFNNYIKYLGMYDGSVNIEIYFKDDVYISGIDIGVIDYYDYINFINGVSDDIVINEYGNGYNVLVNNMDSDKSLFLPINNILGLKIYNNGKLVDTDKYLDNFLSIKLSYGENDIIIKYELPLFKFGLFFSILGIVMLFIYKNMGIKLDILSNIVYYIYMIVVLVFYLYIYVYSFIK